MLNYKEKKNKGTKVKWLNSHILTADITKIVKIPVFMKFSQLRDSDLDRKWNICCVTKSVSKADDSLGTNLRVKGLPSENLLKPLQPHTGQCPLGQQGKESPRIGHGPQALIGGTLLSLANVKMPNLQKSSPWEVGGIEFKHP